MRWSAAWTSCRCWDRAACFPASRLARATGHKARVGSLAPRWGRLEARDVVLYGSPPFEGVPLARIAHITVELGGTLTAPRAGRVDAEGALITYLAIGVGAGAIDNLRGASRGAGGRSGVAGGGPVVQLRDSRLEAFVRLPGRPGTEGLAIRGERFEARREPDGRM